MAKGKYAGVLNKLPKDALAGEPKFRELVGARKAELVEQETKLIGRVKPGALALKYQDVQRRKDLLADEEAALNVEIAALQELLHTTFEEEGITELKLPDGSTVSTTYEPSASVLDKDALIAWAKENGYERMLTLYAQTVTSIAKEILLDGSDVTTTEGPDGTPILTVMGGSVKMTQRPKTSLRKG